MTSALIYPNSDVLRTVAVHTLKAAVKGGAKAGGDALATRYPQAKPFIDAGLDLLDKKL